LVDAGAVLLVQPKSRSERPMGLRGSGVHLDGRLELANGRVRPPSSKRKNPLNVWLRIQRDISVHGFGRNGRTKENQSLFVFPGADRCETIHVESGRELWIVPGRFFQQ
jgi:hypothetical protein